jgi:hypothetical protein
LFFEFRECKGNVFLAKPKKSVSLCLRKIILRKMSKNAAVLSLEDGTKFVGFSFGAETSVQGEVVFNTSMIGWPELLSDPGLRGQMFV